VDILHDGKRERHFFKEESDAHAFAVERDRELKKFGSSLAGLSTAERLAALISKTPEWFPKAEITPNTWFKRRFPGIAEVHGDPVRERGEMNTKPRISGLGEDFFASALGVAGSPNEPTVYVPDEDTFYRYDPNTGIFTRRHEEDLMAWSARRA
jgi:hypothetical protein